MSRIRYSDHHNSYECFLFDEEEDIYNHPYNLSKLHEYLLYVAPRNGLELKFSEAPSLQGLPYNIEFLVSVDGAD